MTTKSIIAPARHAPALLGQTVPVIAAARHRAEDGPARARRGSRRDPPRARPGATCSSVGLEPGASSLAAFDATDFDRLGRFFDEPPGHRPPAGDGALDPTTCRWRSPT